MTHRLKFPQRVAILDMLRSSLIRHDDGTCSYDDDDDDAAIAAAQGFPCSKEHVASVRRDMFGNLRPKTPPEPLTLEDVVRTIDGLGNTLQHHAGHMTNLDQRMVALEARLANVEGLLDIPGTVDADPDPTPPDAPVYAGGQGGVLNPGERSHGEATIVTTTTGRGGAEPQPGGGVHVNRRAIDMD